MTSLILHAFPNRFDPRSRFDKKPRSLNASPLATRSEINVSPLRRHILVPTPTLEPKKDIQYETTIRRQTVLFVVLDLHSQINSNSIASLRTINNDIQLFTNVSTCFNFVQTTDDKIFFISTSNDKQLLEEFHSIKSIEAIFILNSESQMDSRFPKLFKIYAHYEELLMDLKDTLEWYEQTQMEIFVFERDQLFLWLQLWKSEFSKLSKSKVAMNRVKFVEFTEKYYRGNTRTLQTISEFDQNYAKNDTFYWCFSSPFPSRFVQRALHSHDIEQLSICRFLLIDLNQKLQSINKKSSCELYKGMKMTADYIDKFEDHVGKLICSKGFLTCIQSRKQALDDANSPDHRPDLMPVLLKISYDKSISLFELINKNNEAHSISDVYTVFRVKYVNRSQMTTIKIEIANEYGRKFAEIYRMKHQSESVDQLLQELSAPSAKLPSIQPVKTFTHVAIKKTKSIPAVSPRQPLKRLTPLIAIHPANEVDIPVKEKVNLEKQADDLFERGDIDQAIITYEQITPPSARIFSRIAAIFSQKKGDFESAIKFHKRALHLQEQNKEDTAETLSHLGCVYQNYQKYDLALVYHSRALEKRNEMSIVDPVDKAASMIGISNAYWGQKNQAEALRYAQEALILNESIERGNDSNISANLAILANIYYTSGENMKAIEVGQRALVLLERCVSSDSSLLATLMNNLATYQVAVGLLDDARENYNRTLKIFQKHFPEYHPKRISAEKNLQQVIQMQENNRN